MKIRLLLTLKLGVLIALLTLAVATQNFQEIWALVAGTNFLYLLLFIAFNLIAVALASSNLYLLLSPLGKGVPWRRLFYFDRLSLAGASYTPGGIGGLGVVIFMLSREGVGLKDATVATLVDKGITLIVALLFLAVYVIHYHGGVLVVKWYWLGLLALMSALFAVAMYSSLWVRQSVVKIADRVRCYRGHYRLLAINFLITVGIFCLSALQIVAAFSSVGLEMPDWLYILFTYSALLLINYLPISFGGIGLGEAAAVVLWARLGFVSEQILAAFVIWRAFNLISVMLLGGHATVVWWLDRRREEDVSGAA